MRAHARPVHARQYIRVPRSHAHLPTHHHQHLLQGYTKLLQSLGSTIADFLSNLNNLHLHLSMGFPAMAPPGFKVGAVTPTWLELHYYSARPALGPIVVGVLKQLGKTYW